MTALLYFEDAYMRESEATLTHVTPEGGLVFDRTVFRPEGGGQPGDSGTVSWGDAQIEIATTLYGLDGAITLLPSQPSVLPEVGETVTQILDWPRRHRMMRAHTAAHLLAAIMPYEFLHMRISDTSASIDFRGDDQGAAPELTAIDTALNQLIDSDIVVTSDWITRAEINEDLSAVALLNAPLPARADPIRIVYMSTDQQLVDAQPCTGTHVARTAEIGRIALQQLQSLAHGDIRLRFQMD